MDSEEKLVRFFKEDVFTRTTIKYVKPGTDFRTQVAVREEGTLDQPEANLVQSKKCTINYLKPLHLEGKRKGGRKEG